MWCTACCAWGAQLALPGTMQAGGDIQSAGWVSTEEMHAVIACRKQRSYGGLTDTGEHSAILVVQVTLRRPSLS